MDQANDMIYPVHLLNAIGIREAIMAEWGSMECRRLAKQDAMSIQNGEKCVLPQSITRALQGEVFSLPDLQVDRASSPTRGKSMCHYDISQTSTISRRSSRFKDYCPSRFLSRQNTLPRHRDLHGRKWQIWKCVLAGYDFNRGLSRICGTT